jgi:hypothetical protein
MTMPFQYRHTAKQGTHPSERQVPILTLYTWLFMLSLNHAACSVGESDIDTYRQDAHEAILKLNYLLTLSNAELNNRKLTTTKNQNFMFFTKPNKQKVT